MIGNSHFRPIKTYDFLKDCQIQKHTCFWEPRLPLFVDGILCLPTCLCTELFTFAWSICFYTELLTFCFAIYGEWAVLREISIMEK
jgi:hypothetical protein